MRKAVFAIFFITVPLAAQSTENPMFGRDELNSISFYTAQGIGSGSMLKLVYPGLWEFNKMTFGMLQYSQPTTFFRLPARQNLHLVQNYAYGSDRDLSFSATGISLDAAVLSWNGFYTGFGLGPYMRDSMDKWINSRLVFGEKFFIGKSVSDHLRVEFFTIHFSNGNFTNKNKGFNFAGFSLGYSF